jgi:hypothetical protein
MNCGLIHVSCRPGRAAAHPFITARKEASNVIVKMPFFSSFPRLRETCRPSSGITARGSGDHHVMG